jgi:hypothetical protein
VRLLRNRGAPTTVREGTRSFDGIKQGAEHLAIKDGFLSNGGELVALADTDPQLFKGIGGRPFCSKLLFLLFLMSSHLI